MGELGTGGYFNGAENAFNLSGIQGYYQGNGTTTLTDLRIVTSGAPRVIIDPVGQVGIGNLAPQASLEVARGTGASGTAAFAGTTRTSNFNYSTQENTYIRGGKATSDVILNDNGGGVAIGTPTVTSGELLDVNGSTRTVEVHSPGTGTSNLLAMAYGQAGGPVGTSVSNGTGNVTCSRTSAGHYVLTFAGYPTISFDVLAVSLSLNGSSAGFVTSAGIINGTLDVYTYNVSGTLTDRYFNFTVFKP